MKIASPLTLNLTDTRAFKIWLYQLWQGVGGDTDTGDTVTTIVNNYAIQKQTIVNVGSSYVLDKVVNVVDTDVKPRQLLNVVLHLLRQVIQDLLKRLFMSASWFTLHPKTAQ